MTPDRWLQIDQLLEAALQRPDTERTAFLAGACGGDEELRREVESLLVAHTEAEEDFLAAPPLEIVVQDLATEKDLSLVGTSIGHYSLLSVLGVGGMGEVYLAEDARLGRKVALKLLPAEYTLDTARIKRFEREARAASALNHPNIITIYEIGQESDKHFIAAEYIEGKTLRELIEGGRWPMNEVVEIAVQICSALASAHDAGIVHRDIKPENVMLRHDSYIKVVDFGLAKLTERQRSDRETKGSNDQARTNPGVILGTYRYMSPEQALGQVVDHRTDIFSLGVLLYELTTGVPPFKGKSTAATLDAVVHHHPLPVTSLHNDLSPEFERIINRCLEKDREMRYQTADYLRADLKLLKREIDLSPAPVSAVRLDGWNRPFESLVSGMKIGMWLTLAFVGLMVTVGVWRLALKPAQDNLVWGRATATQLTGFAGAELSPAFSPDSKEFVYARNEKGNWDIFLQRFSHGSARNLTGNSPDDDTQPAYSPDGEWIAFRSERQGGGIWVMGSTGTPIRKISETGYYPDWSPDGREIIFSSALVEDPFSRGGNVELYAVNINTRQTRKIVAGPDCVQPRWSPSGRRIVFWGKDGPAQRDIWTVSAHGGDPVQVTNDAAVDWNPVWAPDGKFIYYISNRTGAPSLWRVPIDEMTGRAMGEPEAIIGPLAQSWQLNLSRDGRRLIFVERQIRENIYAVDFDPFKHVTVGGVSSILEGSKRSSGPDISPDGQWLTYYSRGETKEEIYVIKPDGTSPAQLTLDAFNDRLPRWSLDGKQIIYYSNASGKYEIWVINPDGSGRRQISFSHDTGLVYPAMSPDGRWISYSHTGGGAFLLDAHKAWQEQKPMALPFIKPQEEWFIAWSWSPDGKNLAGWSETRKGVSEGSYIYSLESQRFEKIADGGVRPYWLSDNRHLFCIDDGKLFLLDSQTKTRRLLVERHQQEIRGASISSDMCRIYFGAQSDESNIRMLTLD